MTRRLQSVQSRTQRRHDGDQVRQQVQSPYLSAREAIAYLRLGSQSALYRLVKEHGLPHGRRGGLYLFDTREIDAWVHGNSSALEMARARRSA